MYGTRWAAALAKRTLLLGVAIVVATLSAGAATLGLADPQPGLDRQQAEGETEHTTRVQPAQLAVQHGAVQRAA